MVIVYRHQVCSCGSYRLQEHSQVQVEGGRWTTLAEREADPTLIPSDIQLLVSIGDPTWYSCVGCGERIDAALARQWWDEAAKNWDGNFRFIEELGVGVVNPRSVL